MIVDQILQVLPYLGLGFGAAILGGIISAFWTPRVQVRSGIQHFAAGIVIAAISAEVVPELEVIGAPWRTIAGFIAGGLAMVAMKWGVHKFERRQEQRGQRALGIAAASVLDTTIDGVTIGALFAGFLVLFSAILLFGGGPAAGQ